MEANNIDVSEIERHLAAEYQRLQEQRNAAQAQLKNICADAARIKRALSALGVRGTPGKGSPRRSTALTTRDVAQLIEGALAANDSQPIEMLKANVEARARAESRALTGFHLRFRKALESDRFTVVGSGGAAVVSRRQATTAGSA